MQRWLDSALALYHYLYHRHWNGKGLVGPDPGVRWDRVLWRFVKSLFPQVHWKDDRYMLQCQGYWIRNNWSLYRITGEERFKETALLSTYEIMRRQHLDGYWPYPLPGWQGRIATVEGDYAALGLLASYRFTHEPAFLEIATRWYDFLIHRIGFEEYEGKRCVHYFADMGRDMVPNNATLTLALFAELAEVTQDRSYLDHADPMIAFLQWAQLPSGEFPYAVDLPWVKGKTHFMCYQYNAFQFLDLVAYYRFSQDSRIRAILERLAAFLATGLHPDGHCRYACGKDYPEVTYYTAVLAAALLTAHEWGLGPYAPLAEKAYSRLETRRLPDGNYVYSTRNYGLLRDTRSYPRYLAMILRHLLIRATFKEVEMNGKIFA